MPQNAILGSSLIDELVPDIDDLRGLNDEFGARQFKVSRVHRRWSGARRGEGTPTLLLDEEVTPRPIVMGKGPDGLHYELEPGSRHEVGELQVTEVSLQYSEADLIGPALLATDDWYYRLEDALGQGLPPRYYVLCAPPHPDRIKTIGWVLTLERAQIVES